MKNEQRCLFWLPRVFAIFFISFLTLFALDIFIPGKTLGYYLVAFFMHLIPQFFLAVLLIIAWKHEQLGGIFFLLVAIVFTQLFQTYRFFAHFMVISFPLFIIGGLFLLNHFFHEKGILQYSPKKDRISIGG